MCLAAGFESLSQDSGHFYLHHQVPMNSLSFPLLLLFMGILFFNL